MKKNIMKRAWEIRRDAAKNHGCKVSEIEMSECLKMAWAENKGEKKMATEIIKNGKVATKRIFKEIAAEIKNSNQPGFIFHETKPMLFNAGAVITASNGQSQTVASIFYDGNYNAMVAKMESGGELTTKTLNKMIDKGQIVSILIA